MPIKTLLFGKDHSSDGALCERLHNADNATLPHDVSTPNLRTVSEFKDARNAHLSTPLLLDSSATASCEADAECGSGECESGNNSFDVADHRIDAEYNRLQVQGSKSTTQSPVVAASVVILTGGNGAGGTGVGCNSCGAVSANQIAPAAPAVGGTVPAVGTSNNRRRASVENSIHSLESSGCSTSTMDFCRICHCDGTTDQPLISPCYCAGTLRWVHQKCLQQWIKSSQTRSCEVCRYSFLMETKLKPLRKWEKLDMSSVERRKILCSVTFHIIAITCVVWSLYVLIDRTAEEIRGGQLDWPFWTKLVVVAIGFTGGLVFMYVQCKMYVQLFRRWKAYNKVIFVQNCPDTIVGGRCVFSGHQTQQQEHYGQHHLVETAFNNNNNNPC